MDLADLRPHPIDEQELRWRFNEAEGEMGPGSNFGAMVSGAGPQRGHRVGHDPSPRAIRAASRARDIEQALSAIGPELARVLRLAFTPLPASHLVLVNLYPDDLVGLVAETEAAARLYARSRSRKPFLVWLARLPSRVRSGDLKARAVYAEITTQAEAQLGRAGRAYSVARRGTWPSGERPPGPAQRPGRG